MLAGQKAVEDEAESSDEDDDGYGDDLYGDDEDRSRLAAMNEMEREMELFERSEARDRRREARRNKRLLKQSQRKEQARLPRTLLLRPLSCTVMVATASPLLCLIAMDTLRLRAEYVPALFGTYPVFVNTLVCWTC